MSARSTAGPAGGSKEARLGAALRANIAKRKARAHAVRQARADRSDAAAGGAAGTPPGDLSDHALEGPPGPLAREVAARGPNDDEGR